MATRNTSETPTVLRAELVAKMDQLETEREDLNSRIGDQLLKSRRGDRKAAAEAGKLGMKRSGLETELAELRLTLRTLDEETAAEEAQQRERAGIVAYATFDQLTEEARTLEAEFADHVREAAHTGARLRAIRADWERARNDAARHGLAVGDVDAPRRPTGLLKSRMFDDAEAAITQWLTPEFRRTPGASTPAPIRVVPEPDLNIMKIGTLRGGIFGELIDERADLLAGRVGVRRTVEEDVVGPFITLGGVSDPIMAPGQRAPHGAAVPRGQREHRHREGGAA